MIRPVTGNVICSYRNTDKNGSLYISFEADSNGDAVGKINSILPSKLVFMSVGTDGTSGTFDVKIFDKYGKDILAGTGETLSHTSNPQISVSMTTLAAIGDRQIYTEGGSLWFDYNGANGDIGTVIINLVKKQ